MRDHGSIPTRGRQSRSLAPLSPPPHHPRIPFAAVRAPLAPASSPPVVNRVKMWPLCWRLALRNSGLMPICCLLACLSPPHLRLISALQFCSPPSALCCRMPPPRPQPQLSSLSDSNVMEGPQG
jgi:hypothetical protein